MTFCGTSTSCCSLICSPQGRQCRGRADRPSRLNRRPGRAASATGEFGSVRLVTPKPPYPDKSRCAPRAALTVLPAALRPRKGGRAVSVELTPGEQVGRYRVDGMLGRGATACVYRVLDPDDEAVALKLVLDEV